MRDEEVIGSFSRTPRLQLYVQLGRRLERLERLEKLMGWDGDLRRGRFGMRTGGDGISQATKKLFRAESSRMAWRWKPRPSAKGCSRRNPSHDQSTISQVLSTLDCLHSPSQHGNPSNRTISSLRVNGLRFILIVLKIQAFSLLNHPPPSSGGAYCTVQSNEKKNRRTKQSP